MMNGLAGGLAAALPLAIFFVFTFSVYAHGFPPSSYPFTGNWTNIVGFLSDIYVLYPNIYILGRIVLGFLFGFTYATLALATSPFVRSRYLVLAFPLVFFWMFGFAANFAGVPVWWSAYALIPDGILTSSAETIFVPLTVVLLLSVVSIFGLIRKHGNNQLY
jgi:hypothetical protein